MQARGATLPTATSPPPFHMIVKKESSTAKDQSHRLLFLAHPHRSRPNERRTASGRGPAEPRLPRVCYGPIPFPTAALPFSGFSEIEGSVGSAAAERFLGSLPPFASCASGTPWRSPAAVTDGSELRPLFGLYWGVQSV